MARAESRLRHRRGVGWPQSERRFGTRLRCRSRRDTLGEPIETREAPLDEVISGAYVFTVERSARGYALNKMANSLGSADNRSRFNQNEASYMRDMGCSPEQIDLVARRDWKGMLESGASIYLMLKIGAAVGVPLPEIGAHSAGITLAEYNARKAH
jgi:protocatechuate 4,5-dioxygenase alpha subunit